METCLLECRVDQMLCHYKSPIIYLNFRLSIISSMYYLKMFSRQKRSQYAFEGYIQEVKLTEQRKHVKKIKI